MPLPDPFLVVATQNPVELEGTFPLPEAQLDRFLLRIRLGYPDEMEENEILERFHTASPMDSLEAVTAGDEFVAIQRLVTEVHVEPALRGYIVQVVQAPRQHDDVELGASPRATMGLYRCSQALAAIQGRAYITPDDVKALASHALAHRIILKSQARLRDISPESIVEGILSQVPVPV